MDCKYTNIQKDIIESCILQFIPKNKRGFPSKFDMADIFLCIVHKLKTSCQWRNLFIDIEALKPPFSWQTVYYYWRKWESLGILEEMFYTFLDVQKHKLNTEILNLDGTHTPVKKAAESSAYQHRKKAKTSNILIMTDGNGIPIAIGDIISGNHNDLYEVVPQYAKMIRNLKYCGICLDNSLVNLDKGFDMKALRRAIQRRKIIPNVKENLRNRKHPKRGRKRYFNEQVYMKRFVNERCFAWMDSFKTLLVRFDTLDSTWRSWHFLAATLILLKV